MARRWITVDGNEATRVDGGVEALQIDISPRPGGGFRGGGDNEGEAERGRGGSAAAGSAHDDDFFPVPGFLAVSGQAPGAGYTGAVPM